MTAATIFVGPTISVDQVRAVLPTAQVLPPAARGDVYRAACAGAQIIGIVDGVFERVPSIWHKEVLWALEQGVIVLGSSSMGALRAAELDVFGMQGIGRVYELVAAGELDDDDVAVVHAPAEFEHRCLSTAMVNIRESLVAAVSAGIIDDSFASELMNIQKNRFYPDRSEAAISSDADALRPGTGAALTAWLAEHFVDQKHLDALELVHRMASLIETPPPAGKRPRMERTSFFEHMVREEAALSPDGSVSGFAHPVIEELQIQPAMYQAVAEQAIRHRFSRELAMRSGLELDQNLVDATSDRLRHELGLLEPSDLDVWLNQMSMTFDDWAAMVDRQARSAVGDAMLPRLPEADLIDELRLSGHWGELAERSAAKAAALHDCGFDEVGAGSDPLDRDRAMQWWFQQHAGGCGDRADERPDELAKSIGFASPEALSDAVLRAYRHANIRGRHER